MQLTGDGGGAETFRALIRKEIMIFAIKNKLRKEDITLMLIFVLQK